VFSRLRGVTVKAAQHALYKEFTKSPNDRSLNLEAPPRSVHVSYMVLEGKVEHSYFMPQPFICSAPTQDLG
jgi:hypothetical protein